MHECCVVVVKAMHHQHDRGLLGPPLQEHANQILHMIVARANPELLLLSWCGNWLLGGVNAVFE